MASRFPAAWLDELRSRSDIIQVVSGYVALKKSGRNYWGLCPFHGEKTASFSVDPEQQLYYCFGCKAGGNVFSFIMDMERLNFGEAVELLADRAHMPMPEMVNDEDYERRRTRRERLLDANRRAARYYHELLFRPEGAASLAYLRKRGLSDGVIRKFGLGAAPNGWTALTDYMTGQGFTLEELSAVGLTVVKPPEGGSGKTRAFDMFRNRAIFPIIDMYKNVLAFGGRSLDGQEPKYLNTSDTPVFNKRKGVYAANLLRQQRHLDRVILVEGYMDVVSLSQFGVEGVCATLGTALTNEQARLLRRFAPQVYLGYDGDSAGQNAILRGLNIFDEEGIPARVLVFPDGLDPDEFIRRDGAEGFRQLPSISPTAYRLRRAKEKHDLSDREGRLAYAREGLGVLDRLDPLERDVYLKDLEIDTGFSRETLMEMLSLLDREKKDAPAAEAPLPRRRPAPPPKAASPADGDVSAQETLLSCLATGQIPKDMLSEKDFDDDELKSLYSSLISGMSPAAALDLAPDDEARSRYARILLYPVAEDTDQIMIMASQCLKRIHRASLQREYDEKQSRINAMPAGDPAVPALLQEMMDIRRRLDAIR